MIQMCKVIDTDNDPNLREVCSTNFHKLRAITKQSYVPFIIFNS